MRCNDCGASPFIPYSTGRGRQDICVDCWDLRMKLVDAMKTQSIPMETFHKIQRKLAGRRGTGASEIRRALGLDAPTI